jgi:hypothetical protein
VEAFNFELKLVSNVEGVAKRDAVALSKIEVQGKKTADVLGKQFEKIGFAEARRQKKQQEGFSNLWAKLGNAAAKAQERAAKQQERSIIAHERAVEHRVEKLKEQSLMGGLKEGFGTAKLTSAAFYGSALAEGAFKMVDILVEGIHKVVDIFEEGVSRAFEEAGKQQTLRIGEKLSLGAGAGAFREDVGRFSKLTGFDDDLIRGMLLKTRRAGFNQQGARSAFAAAADVAAGEGQGGNAGRVGELVEAFTQIKLKGGVRERMLPGLGVDVKQFYTSLAKELKLGTGQAGIDAAKKRAEEGKIDPQLLLNTIYRGIEAKQGGKLGTGAVEFSKSFEAQLAKVKNLPNEYLKNLVESPSFARASQLLGGLLENLDPESPAGTRIMASINNMFDKIVGFIGDPKDAADSLADKIEDVIDFSRQLVDDFRSWADALLPSLNTLEDMVFAMRKMVAFAEGGGWTKVHARLETINTEEAKVDAKRNERMIERQLREQDPEMFQQALADRLKRTQMYQQASGQFGPINMPAVEQAARADVEEQKNRIRAVTVNVHPGAVVVHAAAGDDPDKAHREAGANMGKHVVRELEKAAQEGGG